MDNIGDNPHPLRRIGPRSCYATLHKGPPYHLSLPTREPAQTLSLPCVRGGEFCEAKLGGCYNKISKSDHTNLERCWVINRRQ